jgi:hypothetical protein
MREAAAGYMGMVLAYDPEPKVSIDFNHTPYSSIFAPDQTKVVGGRTRPRAGLVRQRVGVFLPDGRCGRGDGAAPSVRSRMTDRLALGLASLIVALFLLDFFLLDSGATLFLLRKLSDFIEYLAFWR